MLQKILWYVLLFLARIPHFIQCQETGSLVKWSGSRYETDDEIQKLPNHISCLSVKGTKKLLFQQLQKCFCENGKIFHVFNETWYGCFRPTLTCSDSLDTGKIPFVAMVNDSCRKGENPMVYSVDVASIVSVKLYLTACQGSFYENMCTPNRRDSAAGVPLGRFSNIQFTIKLI